MTNAFTPFLTNPQVSALLSDDETDLDRDLLAKDKANRTTSELESIRRERNRMHAKKTRMRKKRMIQEMEAVRRALGHVCGRHWSKCLVVFLPSLPFFSPPDHHEARERRERLAERPHVNVWRSGRDLGRR